MKIIDLSAEIQKLQKNANAVHVKITDVSQNCSSAEFDIGKLKEAEEKIKDLSNELKRAKEESEVIKFFVI